MDLSSLHFHCDYCHNDLGKVGFETFQRAYKHLKEKGKRGYFCSKNCYEQYEKQFEITYRDIKMYKTGDEEYVPYIGCLYYFRTAEDCYQRMCHKNLCILP